MLRPLPRRVGVARVVLHQGEWKFTYGSSCYDEKAGVKLKVAVKSGRCMLTISGGLHPERNSDEEGVTACG